MVIGARLAAALGIAGGAPAHIGSDGLARVRVDDVDRRFRDAIKAGAPPIRPPGRADLGDGAAGRGRSALVEDPETGLRVELCGRGPG